MLSVYYWLLVPAHVYLVLLVCRFIVAQNRAAVAVENPGLLLANLEALVGTDVFQQRIEEVSAALNATREEADVTAAAMERCVATAICHAVRGLCAGASTGHAAI